MKLPSKNYKTVFSFAILLYLLFIFVLFVNINNLQLRSRQLDEHIQVKTDYSAQIHEINPGLIANNIVRDNKDIILPASQNYHPFGAVDDPMHCCPRRSASDNSASDHSQGAIMSFDCFKERKTTQAISYNTNSVQPPEKVEKLRRKLFNDVRELRYFINYHIIGRYKNQAKREIKDIYEVTQGYKRTILDDLANFNRSTYTESCAGGNAAIPLLETLTKRIEALLSDLDSDLTSIIRGNEGNFKDIAKTFVYNHGLVKITLQNFENDKDSMYHWRYRQSTDLVRAINKQIDELQHPTDCSKARKLLCGGSQIFGWRGFGAQLHEVVLCLMAALGSGRTLILDSKGWSYAKEGWETVFQTINGNCSAPRTVAAQSHSSLFDEKVEVVKMPGIIATMHPRPGFFPRGIPSEISARLHQFHSYPPVWWIGIFVAYLIRPNDEMSKQIQNFKTRLNIESPVIGFHVRRTDKVGDEAGFHSINEYMLYAEEWYDTYELKHPGTPRKVYIASDDPKVVEEARSQYPRYQFLHEKNISISAGLKTRETLTALKGLVTDIYALASCDYIVCTFSSRICRVVFELKQTLHGDAAQNIQSLDDIYFYSGQPARYVRAVENHSAKRFQEISLEKGDEILIRGNHWDGYSLGLNSRTNKEGLYPSYKVEDIYTEGQVPLLSKLPY